MHNKLSGAHNFIVSTVLQKLKSFGLAIYSSETHLASNRHYGRQRPSWLSPRNWCCPSSHWTWQEWIMCWSIARKLSTWQMGCAVLRWEGRLWARYVWLFTVSSKDFLVKPCSHFSSHQCLVGNKRYRICIANNVEAYRNAKSKYHKSMLVSNIVTSVQENAENGIGGFVKKDPVTGRWYQVDDKIAREKVSHALRDAIKVQKRKEARHRRMNDRHHDTKVTANEQGRLQRDTLGAQLALDNMIMRSARPSSIASMFSDKSPQTYYPTKTVQLQNGSGDCLFNGILATFDSWGDDWEQSLKECTERFLKSDDELSFSTMGWMNGIISIICRSAEVGTQL